MSIRLEPNSVASARFCPAPQFAINRGQAKRGRKADGLRYEKKVQAFLREQSQFYMESPWIAYTTKDQGKTQYCQPDGIHFDLAGGRLTIIEVKLSHTAEAQRQLRGVYLPVLGAMFSPRIWTFRLVEICKWYDPDIAFPEAVVMCPDALKYDDHPIGVHVWRP